jgi:hypothetical protein
MGEFTSGPNDITYGIQLGCDLDVKGLADHCGEWIIG